MKEETKIEFYNLHRGYGGVPENVPETSETIQGAAMSIPALLQRAMLGTVDPSGFLRFNDPSLYDHQIFRDSQGREILQGFELDHDPSPTFGDDFAGASEYIEKHKEAVKAALAAAQAKHEQKGQQAPPAESQPETGGSDAE